MHRHALSNSKRGIAVDENGKLDDEVSVISSEVRISFLTKDKVPNSRTLAKPQVISRSLLRRETPSKRGLACRVVPHFLSHSVHHAHYPSITFERIPSDYAILKIIKTPEDAGGDTLWASGYEAFDRLSPVWQRFAEGLTATHHQVRFLRCHLKFPDLYRGLENFTDKIALKAKFQQSRRRAQSRAHRRRPRSTRK